MEEAEEGVDYTQVLNWGKLRGRKHRHKLNNPTDTGAETTKCRVQGQYPA